MSYNWCEAVGMRPDMHYQCDNCGKAEEMGEFSDIYRDIDGLDYCSLCMRDRYATNDTILAFYQGLSEHLSTKDINSSICDARRYFQEKGFITLRNKYHVIDRPVSSKIKRMKHPVRMMMITGIMKSDVVISFVAHLGIADLMFEDVSFEGSVNTKTAVLTPDSICLDSSIIWAQHEEFLYDIFDNPRLDDLFKWAKDKSQNWVLRIDKHDLLA